MKNKIIMVFLLIFFSKKTTGQNTAHVFFGVQKNIPMLSKNILPSPTLALYGIISFEKEKIGGYLMFIDEGIGGGLSYSSLLYDEKIFSLGMGPVFVGKNFGVNIYGYYVPKIPGRNIEGFSQLIVAENSAPIYSIYSVYYISNSFGTGAQIFNGTLSGRIQWRPSKNFSLFLSASRREFSGGLSYTGILHPRELGYTKKIRNPQRKFFKCP